MTDERESAIEEEQSARTELTYASQSLKKTEIMEQKLTEQIVVSEVVISSKKEKIEEETQKTSIIQTQVKTFKKRQELSSKKE